MQRCADARQNSDKTKQPTRLHSSFERGPYASVDRILAVVGDRRPADLDKEKLIAGLAGCLATYYAAVDRRSDKPTKDRMRRLRSIQAAAKRLEEQLVRDDIWDWSEAYWECEYMHQNIKDLLWWLDFEITDLEFRLKWGPDFDEAVRLRVDARTLANRWKARSPFEWLAGHYLPKLFSEHLGIKPTFHRRGRKNARRCDAGCREFGPSGGLTKNLRDDKSLAPLEGVFPLTWCIRRGVDGASPRRQVSHQDEGDSIEPALDLALGGHLWI
jgi:hypothetical protein